MRKISMDPSIKAEGYPKCDKSRIKMRTPIKGFNSSPPIVPHIYASVDGVSNGSDNGLAPNFFIDSFLFNISFEL